MKVEIRFIFLWTTKLTSSTPKQIDGRHRGAGGRVRDCMESRQGGGKVGGVTRPPESELSSIYYDARGDDHEGRSSSRNSQSEFTMNGHLRKRRRRLRCWCCSKKHVSLGEGSEGDAYSADASDYTNTVGSNKLGSNTTTGSSSRKGESRKDSIRTLGTIAAVFGPARQPNQERRKVIPERPDKNMNLWSVLKTAMSKDILRSPLPVNFSEPLSMLQRLAEDYEHSTLLDKASQSNDQYEQICLVAAFCVASYANTSIRTLKPFNPLLGETYEWDRMAEVGWRYISEQVSHHPPTAATHCEGSAGWVCWQDLTMQSKWHVNSCDFNPSGVSHLTFSGSGHHYTWKKVTTCVHNIIWGKLWVDQMGDTVVTNHITGDFCKLQFLPITTWRQQKQVTGTVHSKSGHVKWTLTGGWGELIANPVVSKSNKGSPSQKTIPAPQLLWKIKPTGVVSETGYNMSEFACQLNELEVGVAPTDSRLRPDQRLMEGGLWDEANLEKTRLEEKQRKENKRLSLDEDVQVGGTVTGSSKLPYIPLWFRKVLDDTTSTFAYKYNDKYWEQKEKGNWSMCPNIF